MFVVVVSFFSCNALKCVLMNNQECKVRPEIININSNEPSFYPYTVKISKCRGSCNNINDPYAKLYVPDVSKNMNVKVFNLISRTNETRYITWHETCKCQCRLEGSVFNNKQRWIGGKCRCECKELIGKGICDEWLNWNPSNWECEFDKSCDVGEYLDYKNCKCRKRLVDKLVVEECNENIDEKELHPNKLIYNSTLNDYEKICSSCEFKSWTIYLVFIVIFYIRRISISGFFIFICT